MSEEVTKLMVRYFNGDFDSRATKNLYELLESDDAILRDFVVMARREAFLCEYLKSSVDVVSEDMLDSSANSSLPRSSGRRIRFAIPLAIAAGIALVAMVWMGGGGRTADSEVVAKVSEVTGGGCWLQAIAGGDAGKKRELKVGNEVFPGDRIETGEKGVVVLSCTVGAMVTLDAASVLSIPSDSVKTPMGQVRSICKLEKGSLNANVAKQQAGKLFVLETPQALVEVLGTRFQVTSQ